MSPARSGALEPKPRAGRLGVAERLQQQVAVRVLVTVFLAPLALVDLLLDVGVVLAAVLKRRSAEVIEPAVAHPTPVHAVGLQHHGDDRAVRLRLGQDPIEADDRVRLDDDLAQQLVGLLVLGREIREQIRRGADDLLGGGRAALVPTRAVGKDDERGAAQLRARDDRDAVLLLLPVADVLAGGGVEGNGHRGWAAVAPGTLADR